MPFATRILAIALLALSLGFHWGIVQTAAWVGMIVDRVQCGSVSEAFRSTFDGQHPCRLCLVVREGRAAEGRETNLPNPKVQTLGLDLILDGPVNLPVAWDSEAALVIWPGDHSFAARLDPPDTPPPRRHS